MIANVKELKELLLWCRDNGITSISVDNISAEIMPASKAPADPTKDLDDDERKIFEKASRINQF